MGQTDGVTADVTADVIPDVNNNVVAKQDGVDVDEFDFEYEGGGGGVFNRNNRRRMFERRLADARLTHRDLQRNIIGQIRANVRASLRKKN